MLDRLEKFEDRINKYRASKQHLDSKTEVVKFGYSKNQSSDSTRIMMRGDDRSKFVKVNQSIEKKVRNLLEGTELVDIAKSAKIVVEIVKEEQI